MSTPTFDVKAWKVKILAFIKAGRITIHDHEVRADKKETLLGSCPVMHAKDADLEALALIHEPVGGASYVTASTNTSYQGAVGTSHRNLVRPTNPKKKAIGFKECAKELGFEAPAFWDKHRYGGSQELDAVIRDCNKRIKEIDSVEFPKAIEAGDKAIAKALVVEKAELATTKANREFDMAFGDTD